MFQKCSLSRGTVLLRNNIYGSPRVLADCLYKLSPAQVNTRLLLFISETGSCTALPDL